MFKKLLDRCFSCRRMLGKNRWQGDIPHSKEIYRRAFSVAWPAALEFTLTGLIGFCGYALGQRAESGRGCGGRHCHRAQICAACVYPFFERGRDGCGRAPERGRERGGRPPVHEPGADSLRFSRGAAFICGHGVCRARASLLGRAGSYLADAALYFRIISIGVFFKRNQPDHQRGPARYGQHQSGYARERVRQSCQSVAYLFAYYRPFWVSCPGCARRCNRNCYRQRGGHAGFNLIYRREKRVSALFFCADAQIYKADACARVHGERKRAFAPAFMKVASGSIRRSSRSLARYRLPRTKSHEYPDAFILLWRRL